MSPCATGQLIADDLGQRPARPSPSQRRFSIGRRRAALHGITPVEHDDDSEHCPSINDLRYVIQNNSDALSAACPGLRERFRAK